MAKLAVQEVLENARKLLIDEGKIEEATSHFNFLFNNEPDSIIYPYYLGCCYHKLDQDALAVSCFKDAIAKDPSFAEAWSNMGYVYFKMQDRDTARECWQQAIAISNSTGYEDIREQDFVIQQKAEFLVNLASTFVANGTPQEAIDIIDKAQEIRETDNGHWNRGLALLELGNYKEGWLEYEYGERVNGGNNRKYNHPGEPETPFWDGTKGQTVVVYGEQGIGDELMFASMIPDMMKDCTVIFEAHPRLADMFRNSFSDIPIYGTRKDKKISWPIWSKVDAKLSLGSLGKFYRNSREDFPGTPYIIPNPVYVEYYSKKFKELSDRPKIGISWKGGNKKTGKSARVIPMDMLKTLFDLDCDIISLQYDENAQHEVDKFNESTGLFIHHWPFTIDNYDHTAAMIKNLDMIISVPQSVVHLAGSIGVPTIQLCPIKALWQMGVMGENMPWYSSVVNVWQEIDGDWSLPLQRAKEFFLESRKTDANH